MAKYYIGIDVNLRAYAEVEAEDLGEAIEKAKNSNYEMPDLNNGDYIEDYLVNVLDENYNQVHKF